VGGWTSWRWASLSVPASADTVLRYPFSVRPRSVAGSPGSVVIFLPLPLSSVVDTAVFASVGVVLLAAVVAVVGSPSLWISDALVLQAARVN
jgi:hypothetical protein